MQTKAKKSTTFTRKDLENCLKSVSMARIKFRLKILIIIDTPQYTCYNLTVIPL